MFKILITKETRANETRVGLIPTDVTHLVQSGHKVFIENHAGLRAGFSNQQYEHAGAVVMKLETTTVSDYARLFNDINLIVRVKRPSPDRERIEFKSIQPGTIMIGALDPLERNSIHVQAYRQARIIPYSIDQLNTGPSDPLNILASMSKIAGRLALADAMGKFKSLPKKLVIIGYGVAGAAALQEGLRTRIHEIVVVTSRESVAVMPTGARAVVLEHGTALSAQQNVIRNSVLNADIVIACARKPNQPAPLLLPSATLEAMRPGSVVVDMALSEGGNVAGSEHDQTRMLGNGVLVTNVSGYPKAEPHEASRLWSRSCLGFIQLLATHPKDKRIFMALC
jgi:NAD/NADP transhydrogenase alpha subunit